MRHSFQKLLQQIDALAAQGHLGDEVRESRGRYQQLPGGLAAAVVYVDDFLRRNEKLGSELSQVRNQVLQLLLVVYRESRLREPDVSQAFAQSLIEDYPNIPGSALLPRWTVAVKSSLALRGQLRNNNPNDVWQLATQSCVAANEFINGLLGFVLIAWAVYSGSDVKSTIFKKPYRLKLELLSQLTGGEDGPFYLFNRLGRPDWRNAIAHSTMWLDGGRGQVHYSRPGKSDDSVVSLTEFMAITASIGHFPSAYLASCAVIVVWEIGSDELAAMLPPQLVRLLNANAPEWTNVIN